MDLKFWLVLLEFNDDCSPEVYGPFGSEKGAEDWAAEIKRCLHPRVKSATIMRPMEPFSEAIFNIVVGGTHAIPPKG